MTVTRDSEGGTSFFHLSGELRNTIYKHFIDLKPSAMEAANLACVHKQVHSEFGTLFLLPGEIRLHARDLSKFLCSFYVRYPSSALKDVRCEIEAMVSWGTSYSADLLPVLSILRQYPLLNIALLEWHDNSTLEGEPRWPFEYFDFEESFLTNLGARHFKKLVSVNVFMNNRYEGLPWDNRIDSELLVVLKKGVSKRTVKNWERSGCGNINVVIRTEDHLDIE